MADLDVYGAQFADGARDRVVELLKALKTTMATGYDPSIGYVYDSHTTALLRLNAVTVEVMESTATPEGVDNGTEVNWLMSISCRVHTAYLGDRFDERDTMRLAEGVCNKLQKNLFTYKADNYWIQKIESIKNSLEFSESATMGAEIIVLMMFDNDYEQE